MNAGVAARAVLLSSMALGCTAGAGHPPTADEQAQEAALQETAALCQAGVNLGPSERDAVARRIAQQQAVLAAGVTHFDDAVGELTRVQDQVRRDCYDQVLPALSGESATDAVRILREARTSCEAEGVATSSTALAACIHARKIELFVGRRAPDSLHDRETLDRLLRVGGGAPLSPEERAAYCRTRELDVRDDPLCP